MLTFLKKEVKMFGDNLKKIRKQNKIGQVELAKRLNVANGTISMWENNLRTPDLATIKAISKFFNVPISYLIEEQQKEPEQIESVIGFQSQSHKECIELINQLTESQALKLCGYIERMLEDEQNKKEKLNKGEN